MKITTRPAVLTAAQKRHMLDNGAGVQEVLRDGVPCGQVAKNKHGIWIGHFDPLAYVANDNPFSVARLSHKVMPSIRGQRTKADVVADVAATQVGRYERYIRATGVLRERIAAGQIHQATSLWDLPMDDFSDAMLGKVVA